MQPEFQLTDPPPPVLAWYKAYCFFLAAFQGLPITLGWLAASIRHIPTDAEGPDQPYPLRAAGISLILMGLVFAVLNVAVTFLPRKPWAWLAHLINLIMGALSICFIPLTIPLLIAWVRPDVRRYYSA